MGLETRFIMRQAAADVTVRVEGGVNYEHGDR